MFEEEKEIANFSTPQELKEKINYYLYHDDKRMQMAEDALRKVVSHYTYLHRAKRMFEVYEAVR